MNRLEKNKNISNTMRETYAKRKFQTCKCFKFKVDKSNLSKIQAQQLKMQFVEAKWIYNYLLSQDNIYSFDYKNLTTITHKDKNKNDVITAISYLSSSLKQSLIKQIINQIKGLSILKKRGYTVGKLKFKSEFNSIDLKQYGNTHSIRGNKFKIQGIKKPIRVRGLKQLYKYENIDFANAKLYYDGNDYFIILTCYFNKIDKNRNNNIVGIDMGVSNTLTLSNGEKYDISIEESERLKKLQVKLDRQIKGSNNQYKTIKKLKKEYNHINNKKNDITNKLIHYLLDNYDTIVIQDEQIKKWKEDGLSGPKIQHSILGRIKNKLISSNQVVVLDKWFPTSKFCSNCGEKYDKLKLEDREFVCPHCGNKKDRDIHAANNMIYFYLKYINLDRSGTDQTSKKPVTKILYANFANKPPKQEDTMSLALC